MIKYLLALILGLSVIGLAGCSVVAIKGNEKMVLKGWGAQKAVFSDNSSIEKSPPAFKVPDILPQR